MSRAYHAPTIWIVRVLTIGHSTRTLDELIALCHGAGIALIADVRRFPASRRHPQFNREALSTGLADAGIAYRWFEALGGRRNRRRDTRHTAWQVAAFAGYADHMETAEFRQAAAKLLAEAADLPEGELAAVMCAEAHPSQCHRRLVADWLLAHGVVVEHVIGPGRLESHTLTPWARLEGDHVVYDVGQLPLV
jgi:uncharacterized protein (DUF488 family)